MNDFLMNIDILCQGENILSKLSSNCPICGVKMNRHVTSYEITHQHASVQTDMEICVEYVCPENCGNSKVADWRIPVRYLNVTTRG